jgi:hypothetical protein
MRLNRVTSRIGVILVTGGLFVALGGGAALAAQGSPNGAATQRPVFYEGQRVTVNMFEVPASEALLKNNPNINTIYASNDLDEEQDFLSVIDAIQGEGFNPLWHQVLIVFNEGFTAHQFVSEDQVLAAASGANPEITLVSTDEVYRCSIVGSK